VTSGETAASRDPVAPRETGPQLRPLNRPIVGVTTRDRVPWAALLAVASIILTAVCAGGATVVIRRRPSPPAPDEIEAELQELLAEERMKQLQSR
jgi:hypothetical protein